MNVKQWILVSVSVLSIVCGIVFAVNVLNNPVDAGSAPPPAPLPATTISAPASVAPVGPTAVVSSAGPTAVVTMSAGGMEPSRLLIPALDVYAPVEQRNIVGNELELNEDPNYLTQWARGSKVTDRSGTVLVSGHVSVRGRKGALWPLSTIKAGNLAFITDSAGRRSVFKLVSLDTYWKRELPADIWSVKGPRRLVLVTCGGTVVDGVYAMNVVATFVPVS